MARPTKYTPETARKVAELLEVGNTRRAAALASGISEDTFGRWLERFADFADAVKKAEAAAETAMVQIIRDAASENWTAAAWYLERRRPDDWGKREKLDVTAEVQVKVLRGVKMDEL